MSKFDVNNKILLVRHRRHDQELYININIFISVDIEKYHDKCHIICLKFKGRFLLLSEDCGFKLLFIDREWNSKTFDKSEVDHLCVIPPDCVCKMHNQYIDIYIYIFYIAIDENNIATIIHNLLLPSPPCPSPNLALCAQVKLLW